MRAEDADHVRAKVRAGYGVTAHGQGTLVAEDPHRQALAFGYSLDALTTAPRGANLGLGCGDPTATAGLQPGETVVDLGCGAGLDVFIASRAVGPTGTVIGIDMTAPLLERARHGAREGGYTNVEFRLGTMEALPLDDGVADVIVSNCAINLSPEKRRVFAEAVRVLRGGGRLAVSDLIVHEDLPPEISASVEAYVGCVGGATTRDEYVQLVVDAGFEAVEVVETFSLVDIVSPTDGRVHQVLADAGVAYTDDEIAAVLSTIKGVSVRARRPQTRLTSRRGATERDATYSALLSYVLSNAAAGEIMAVDNYSDMVSLFHDVDEKLAAVNQAREEGRHIRQLASLGTRVGFPVAQRIVEPQWKAVRAAFGEAVTRGDLAACLVIQDVMVESMAIVTYRTLAGADGVETDPATARTVSAILDDELEHLEIGIARLQALRDHDPEAVDRAVTWAHPLVMPQLLSLASTSCESLCDVLSVDCATLDPDIVGADLGLVRARAANQYADALDRIGIPMELSDILLGDLGAMEVGDPQRLSCGPDGCC